jgi:hypothetical protein
LQFMSGSVFLYGMVFSFRAMSKVLVFRGFGSNGGSDADRTGLAERPGRAEDFSTELRKMKAAHVFSISINYCFLGPCPDHSIKWRIQFPSQPA